MSAQPIAVYGASGHTGRFVLRELTRRGYPSIPIARNPASPPLNEDGLDTRKRWRQAGCDDPEALDEALRGSGAVINCAGPFLDTAPAVIEAALRAGIHYFDITAEQRSARQTLPGALRNVLPWTFTCCRTTAGIGFPSPAVIFMRRLLRW